MAESTAWGFFALERSRHFVYRCGIRPLQYKLADRFLAEKIVAATQVFYVGIGRATKDEQPDNRQPEFPFSLHDPPLLS